MTQIFEQSRVDSKPTTDTGSLLVNVNYKVSDSVVLSGFSYLLANIHDTYAARVSGKVAVSDGIKLNYAASYAMQADNSLKYGTNAGTRKISANYIDAALGANISGFIVGGEYKLLGKAANTTDADGFSTPLAIFHKFQGFADEFLVQTKGVGKNKNGLADMSLKAGYKAKGFGKALVFFHKFDAQTGTNTDLGSEIDALYGNKIPGFKNLKGLIKVAYFMGGETGSGHENDNAKAWAQLDYKS